MDSEERAHLQRQIDELVGQITTNRGEIDALTDRADAAEVRADRAEVRADRAEVRADRAEVRADQAEARADQQEARSTVDREMIAELQADGVVGREHVAQLERALATSRTIGAAVGILMASRYVDEAQALKVLKEASSRSNTPMRTLAEVIVAGRPGA